MAEKQKKKHKLSKVSLMHYWKMVFRSILLVAAALMYIYYRMQGDKDFYGVIQDMPLILEIIWVVYFVEMLLRFFPSKIESLGCQKQFARNYRPVDENQAAVRLQSGKSTFAVALAWIILNSIIGILFFKGMIDEGILLLISLAYGVCDMICILFFCPFQTWFMKNKCCTTCRIYNWDFAMMFTPFVFIKSFYTWSLLGIALLLLLNWEVLVRIHPERFSESTNACISCANCPEKLCSHKTQLQHFIKDKRYRAIPVLIKQKINEVTDKSK